ncbi:hypothetical protein TrLO_g7726 [Triparma laevis f. longispina]|uniref:Dienelactone hydrolase domain-containing protein n=1 Tax=Triparma laevis f. longispina TaxID=1714387 RepID=A0A9W7AWB1_9STRA|nr:hypothetical protein TrLO_g7726 [Triparma laevis f. longispina]
MSQPAACCPPESLPHLPPPVGPRSGTTIVIEGKDGADDLILYIIGSLDTANPATKAVVIYSDVFGEGSGNHRRFADHLQSSLGSDYVVVLPDFFRGAPALNPISFLPSFLSDFFGAPGMIFRLKFTYTFEPVIKRDSENTVVPWLKSKGVKQFACVGFCFGGWCVGQSLALPAKPFSCGVGIHPSFNVEMLHGGTEEKLAEAIGNTPILLLPAQNDRPTLKPGGECVKMLAAARGVKEEDVSVPYSDMIHGWVTRGDDSKSQRVADAQADALKRSSEFISKNINNNSGMKTKKGGMTIETQDENDTVLEKHASPRPPDSPYNVHTTHGVIDDDDVMIPAEIN